jgi:C-terminal processing protease CtpA/Prc/tricorn protease-like protein
MTRWTLLLVTLASSSAHALLHDPAVSRTHVAFVYDGQVWVVKRGETAARRVTTTPGKKYDPRFSPDGRRLAFSSGSLYTVPLSGGTPARVTWLPSDQVLCQWTEDDRLLFHTSALSFVRLETQLFTVSSKGGLPQKLPLAYGSDGALDGEWLAYTPQWPNNLIAWWKRYRGGAAPDVRLVDLRTRESLRATEWSGSDLRPMWHRGVLHYTSDASGRLNLWSFDPRTRKRVQLTRFEDYDVRNPSYGAGAIVFQLGPDLHLFDIDKSTATKLRIDVPPTPRTREVDAAQFITHRDRGLVEARGDLWLNGRNVTNTSGAFEREASLSPDGRRIVYSSDESGEYQLYVYDGAPRKLTNFKDGFRYRPVWSPDARRIAFTDHTTAIFVMSLDDGKIEQIGRDPWTEQPELAFSPDSTSLVYTRSEPNRLSVLMRHDLATGAKQQLTSSDYAATTPSFEGEWLHYMSYRNFSSPVYDWISHRVVHRDLGVRMRMPLARLHEQFAEKVEEKAEEAEEKVRPMKMTIDVRAEWRQLFLDAWRLYRDFYYAPKVNGTARWDDVRRRYEAMLEQAATRDDVNWILAEMIGESSTGHAYLEHHGDTGARLAEEPIGMLGVDYELENGVYRFARVYPGLSHELREGDSLFAVNGVPVDAAKDPRAAFLGLANKEVTLRVGADAASARDLRVTPVASENDLRYRAWVARNRAYAEQASGGRVGYLHVPAFNTTGLSEASRQFYGQIARDALIVDARWSPGGWAGAALAELLGRKPLNYAASRHSDRAWPAQRYGAHFGPKALLVNHLVVSAGENFAHYFRTLGLGPLVGARTWGGLTGLNPVPRLIDGGAVNVPNAPFFDQSGWLIEGHGIEPDVTVEDDPAARDEFTPDPQLVAAVKKMMEAVPYRAPEIPR